MTTPEVMRAHWGGSTVYMVASRSTPGAYWPVRFFASQTEEHPYPIECPCPAGTDRPALSCRHMRAAAAFMRGEDEQHRRPTYPVHPGLTD